MKNSFMVNHGLAAKLTETDLLLLRSLGRLFSYQKNHFFMVSKKFLQCNFNFCLKMLCMFILTTQSIIYSYLLVRETIKFKNKLQVALKPNFEKILLDED